MNKRLFGVTCVLILLGSASVSGCGLASSCVGQRPKGIVTRDLVGTYHTGLQASRSLTLKVDGSFIARGWHTGAGSSGTVAGVWDLESADAQSTGDISLTFEPMRGTAQTTRTGSYLGVEGSRTEPVLFEFDGDPDNCEVNRLKRT